MYQGENMRLSNQRYFAVLQIVLDIVSVYAALVLTYYLRFQLGIFPYLTDYLPFEDYIAPVFFLTPIYLLLYNLTGHYKLDKKLSLVGDTVDVVKAHAISLPVFMSILFVLRTIDYSRIYIALYTVVIFVISILTRYMLTGLKSQSLKRSQLANRVLIVGFSNVAREYIKKSNDMNSTAYVIHGILDDRQKLGYTYGQTKVIGTYDDLASALRDNEISEVILAVPMEDFPKLDGLVNLCETYGVHTRFIPDYYQYIPSKPFVEDFDGIPMISIRRIPLNDYMNRTIKRSMDLVFSLTTLIVLMPFITLIALLIKLTSRGPIFYRQARVGLNRKEFIIYKFRSMTVQASNDEKTAWTTKDDVRVTGLGKFMRRTNIDELPQLFNVLKGDMSLIGPRPERPYFVEQFMHTIPKYMIKHQVRPGMSGWAQVNGWRGNTSIDERIKHDIYYIENWTLLLDIRIILLTIFGRKVHNGAY